jgi:two-component system chemotaxis response regulator CheB
VGILVVQHMPVGFTGPFARRLDNLCKVRVCEASPNELIEPGVVYIAPAGWHMTVERRTASKCVVRIAKLPDNSLHIPSVDVMMLSVAEVYRGLSMGVILTGMGADGALGMKAIGGAGGLTVGQDEATCTVYGMPRSCAEMGVLQRVVPLRRVPEEILRATGYSHRS